jgi:hypothetical protein
MSKERTILHAEYSTDKTADEDFGGTDGICCLIHDYLGAICRRVVSARIFVPVMARRRNSCGRDLLLMGAPASCLISPTESGLTSFG